MVKGENFQPRGPEFESWRRMEFKLVIISKKRNEGSQVEHTQKLSNNNYKLFLFLIRCGDENSSRKSSSRQNSSGHSRAYPIPSLRPLPQDETQTKMKNILSSLPERHSFPEKSNYYFISRFVLVILTRKSVTIKSNL